jgi:hypothetical protein
VRGLRRRITVAGADGVVLCGLLGGDAADSGVEVPLLRHSMERRRS